MVLIAYKNKPKPILSVFIIVYVSSHDIPQNADDADNLTLLENQPALARWLLHSLN